MHSYCLLLVYRHQKRKNKKQRRRNESNIYFLLLNKNFFPANLMSDGAANVCSTCVDAASFDWQKTAEMISRQKKRKKMKWCEILFGFVTLLSLRTCVYQTLWISALSHTLWLTCASTRSVSTFWTNASEWNIVCDEGLNFGPNRLVINNESVTEWHQLSWMYRPSLRFCEERLFWGQDCDPDWSQNAAAGRITSASSVKERKDQVNTFQSNNIKEGTNESPFPSTSRRRQEQETRIVYFSSSKKEIRASEYSCPTNDVVHPLTPLTHWPSFTSWNHKAISHSDLLVLSLLTSRCNTWRDKQKRKKATEEGKNQTKQRQNTPSFSTTQSTRTPRL